MCNASRISENLLKIKEKADKYSARVVVVTKYYPIEFMQEAYKAGAKDFGESRLPYAIEKINSLDDEMRSDCSYHLIGHLQTNKVKRAVGFFNLIQTLDSIRLADEISKEAQKLGVTQKVLIQVNNAREEQKNGIEPSQLENLIGHACSLKNVKIMGLMNIAPLTDDIELLKKLFRQMYKLKEEFALKELSMGMSNDYEIALDCGATIIRPGRAVFK